MSARGVYRIEGLLAPLVLGQDLSASLQNSGNLNYRSLPARRSFDASLRGELLPDLEPPSWTQYRAGKDWGVVIGVLSSSDDFSGRWNAFASGS